MIQSKEHKRTQENAETKQSLPLRGSPKISWLARSKPKVRRDMHACNRRPKPLAEQHPPTIHTTNKLNVSSTWNTANLTKMNTGMRTRELKSKKLKKWRMNMRTLNTRMLNMRTSNTRTSNTRNTKTSQTVSMDLTQMDQGSQMPPRRRRTL